MRKDLNDISSYIKYGVNFRMKKKWKGVLIGGIVGGIYGIIGTYYLIASSSIGYDCPIEINSLFDFIFYPLLKLSCLGFLGDSGLVGLFLYSLSIIFLSIIIGGLLGKLLTKK